MASAVPLTSYGLTISASVIVSAAPQNLDSTRTPGLSSRLATYSLATRFMPSLKGVTRQMSASL